MPQFPLWQAIIRAKMPLPKGTPDPGKTLGAT
jgi:hypothetical protein